MSHRLAARRKANRRGFLHRQTSRSGPQPVRPVMQREWLERETGEEDREIVARTMAGRLLEEGRQEGRGEIWRDLLAEGFGQVPGDCAERVRWARMDGAWSRVILRAPDPAGVFRPAAGGWTPGADPGGGPTDARVCRLRTCRR